MEQHVRSETKRNLASFAKFSIHPAVEDLHVPKGRLARPKSSPPANLRAVRREMGVLGAATAELIGEWFTDRKRDAHDRSDKANTIDRLFPPKKRPILHVDGRPVYAMVS